MIEMLEELTERSEKALSQLDTLVREELNYYEEALSKTMKNFNNLSKEDVQALKEFKEAMTVLLSSANTQAKEKLLKLIDALNRNAIYMHARRNTYWIEDATRSVRVYAQWRKSWIFQLAIYAAVNTVFPDILKLPDALALLQVGWRASDETLTHGYRARMTTTKPWQVLAWCASRPGTFNLGIVGLNLNKTKTSFKMILTSSWRKTLRDKREALSRATRSAISMLTWYLGDGKTNADSLRFAVGNGEVTMPKSHARAIVEAAYKCGYGQLLDAVGCEKWYALKKLTPRLNPIHAQVCNHTFLIEFSESRQQLSARAQFKSKEEVEKCIQMLAALGVKASMYEHKYRCWRYWTVYLGGNELLKLAERHEEWRRALRELVARKNVQPITQQARKLLELAESPPLLRKSFLTSSPDEEMSRGSSAGRHAQERLAEDRLRKQKPGGPGFKSRPRHHIS